jgi:hypothetical protein
VAGFFVKSFAPAPAADGLQGSARLRRAEHPKAKVLIGTPFGAKGAAVKSDQTCPDLGVHIFPIQSLICRI